MIITMSSPGSMVIRKAAGMAGVNLYGDNAEPVNAKRTRIKCRLAPGDDGQYYRRSHSGRKVFACCAHGHYAFARNLFALDPAAVIRSAMGTVTRDNLEEMDAAIRHRNIGSQFAPMEYGDACDCAEGM